MSPVSSATQDQRWVRTIPFPPYPTADLLSRLATEIVVDWQLPSDLERKS